MLDFRYRAFLCYSHRDSDWADWLHHAIEDYPIPPRLIGITTGAGVIPARLAPVFRDRDELPSATDLSAKVSDALAQSANLVVICSPHAAQSHWVNEEVKTFQRLGRVDRIFCLIVDGEPGASAWAGREHDECIAPALTHRFDASGRDTGGRLEPIAADVRPGKDGRSNARTKIVAGLLGVDLDDLRHRERRRRRWRLTAAIAAGLMVLCLTTALAVNAVIARHAAERRQKQAEDLIGFMLGDLDDKLRQVNRLDILESVADKSVKYFASMPVADVNDATLAQGARALQKIGRVRFDQGRLQDAGKAFSAAEATTSELLRRMPASADYAKLEAETLSWLGRVSWARGDLGDALQRFQSALDRLASLPAAQQEDAALMDTAGTLHTNIGRVLEARGDLDAAHEQYVIVLSVYERLSSREPDRLNWKSEVAYAHNNLGQIAWKEGRLDEAIREYAADRRMKASLAAIEPNSNTRREDLLIGNAILGRNLAAVGETKLADRYLRAAVDESERLLRLDPSVTGWQEDAGYYSMMLSALARARGDVAEANRFGESALTRLRTLARQDPENVPWARELVEAELEGARRLLAQRRLADAETAIGAADARFRGVIRDDASDRSNVLMLARVDLLAGDVAEAQGHADKARLRWQAAEAGTRDAGAATHDPAWLHVRLDTLLRLGDVEAARAPLQQLAAMSYLHPDLVASVAAHGLTLEPDAAARERISAVVATLASGTQEPLAADVETQRNLD